MKYLHLAALLLLVSSLAWAAPTPSDDDSESSDDATDKAASSTESKAGEAIKTLLQEKITQKFKEAANEVKGVLVKQLGDSLKSAHEAFNPPKEKELKKVGAGAAPGAKATESKTSSAAKLHQNKANRHRKNSGPQATASIPEEAKVEAKTEGSLFKKPPPPPGPKPPPPPGPPGPPGPPPILPPPPPPSPCAPCGMAPPQDACCTPQNTQFMVSQVNLPAPPPPMPPPPPPPPACIPICQQVCAPGCNTQCCGKRKKKRSSIKKSRGTK